MNRQTTTLAARLALLCCTSWAVAGCGSRPSKDELGTIERRLPKVAGAETPFAMPQLDAHSTDVAPESAQPAAGESGEQPAVENAPDVTEPHDAGPIANEPADKGPAASGPVNAEPADKAP
jgi:hypothetical protein